MNATSSLAMLPKANRGRCEERRWFTERGDVFEWRSQIRSRLGSTAQTATTTSSR